MSKKKTLPKQPKANNKQKEPKAKILHVVDGPGEFINGCFFDRMFQPGEFLRKKGYEIKTLFLRSQISQDWIEYPDVVMFTRWYNSDPRDLLYAFKEAGKPIIYEIDDDVWKVPSVNPTKSISQKNLNQIEFFMNNADMVTTTTDYLKSVLEEYNDNVKVCPNAINKNLFKPPLNASDDELKVVWSGSVTHYEDLRVVLPVIKELQKEYDFKFILQGISSQPLISEIYNYKLQRDFSAQDFSVKKFFDNAIEFWEDLQDIDYEHIPFYPPQLHPQVMRKTNGDIGICPLTDNEFNRSKSANKFFQYAGLGMATLASDVIPYNKVMDYTAENTVEDWKEKLEKLITDEDFRKELAQEQRQYVLENRSLDVVVDNTWDKYIENLIKKVKQDK